MKIVLQKFIANSGYCSRRKAEELIRDGKVKVNGETAVLGARVDASDKILVEDKVIEIKSDKSYYILNKPVGYTCTSRKFKDEMNVFDLVKTEEKLHVVGRLDKNSRGLVLLTNDGDLTQKLTHPSFEHEKEYEILVKSQKVHKVESRYIIKKFKAGIDIGDGDGVVRAKIVKCLADDKYMMVLTEGKKRQIRRMFEAVGCKVLDLARVRIGKIKLGNLEEGKWKKLNKEEVKILKS